MALWPCYLRQRELSFGYCPLAIVLWLLFYGSCSMALVLLALVLCLLLHGRQC